jgi:ArsR family transcriptional regulator
MSKPKFPVPLCPAILEGEFSRAQAEKLAALFRALADPARVRLLSLIAAQSGAEACACHFTARMALSQPTVSHHLKVLREAGLLKRERRGNWLHYHIVPERLAMVSAALWPAAARMASHG